MSSICAVCGLEKSDTRLVETLSYPNERNRADEEIRVCSECDENGD